MPPEKPLQPEPQAREPMVGAAKSQEVESSDSAELVLHEIGEVLVAAAVSTQRESQRYHSEYGQSLLAELEVELPAKLRIDDLGQMRVKVVKDLVSTDAVARIKLRVTHSAKQSEIPTTIASQNLREFAELTSVQRSKLAKYRVFTGDDLRRVARNAPGYEALKMIIGSRELDKTLDSIELASTPGLSTELSTALLRVGITSRSTLLETPTEEITSKLSALIDLKEGQKIISDLKEYVKTLHKQ